MGKFDNAFGAGAVVPKGQDDKFDSAFTTPEAVLEPEAPTQAFTPTPGGFTDEDVEALIEVESKHNPDAVSPAGAQGLAQIMPATAKDPGFGVDPVPDPTDPVQARKFVRQYMGAMLERYDGNIDDALRAYNWGVGNSDQYIRDGRQGFIPQETRDYVERFGTARQMRRARPVVKPRLDRIMQTPAATNIENEEIGLRVGVPPEVVSRDPARYKREAAALDVEAAFTTAPDLTQAFVARNPDATYEDIDALAKVEHSWVGDVARQAGTRVTTLAGSFVRGIGTITEGIAGRLEEAIPLTEFLQDRFPETLSNIPSVGEAARTLEGVDFGGVQHTTWEELKDAPLSLFLPFAIEQGLVSTADMVASIAALPAYVVARTGEIAQNRAVSDVRDNATVGDMLAAAPAAVASSMLEKLGARGILGLDDALKGVGAKAVAKATARGAAKEGGTEFAQEVIESVAETTGTVSGFDLGQTLERGVQGFVAGTGFGASVRSITATVESTAKAQGAKKEASRREATAKAAASTQIAQASPELAVEHLTDVLESGEGGAVSMAAEGLTPEQAAEIGISERAYTEASVIGADIDLTAEQHAKLMLRDDYEGVNRHIRTNDAEMTLAEAEEFETSGLAEEIQALGDLEGEQFASDVISEAVQPATRQISNVPEPFVIVPDLDNDGNVTGFDVTEKKADGTSKFVSRHETLDEAARAVGGEAVELESALDPRIVDFAGGTVTVAQEQLGLQGLFSTADEAGMTQKQYEGYLVAVQRARDGTVKRQQKKILKQKLAENSEAQIKEREALREGITRSVFSRPVYAALSALGVGRKDAIGVERMNRKAVVDALPEGADLGDLPTRGRKKIYAASGEPGVLPAILAEEHGFPSPDIMLFSMMDALPAEEVIDAEIDAEMKKRHGDLLQAEEAINSAIEELHNDNTAEVLATELNALREARGEGRIKAAAVRQAARDMLGRVKVKDLRPAKFFNAERRWAREAGKALRKGDRGKAVEAKFKQLINHQMGREAIDAQKKTQQRQKFLAKFTRRGQNFKGIDARFVDMIFSILENVSFRPRLSDKKRQSLTDEAAKVASDTGAIFIIPPAILHADGRLNYRDMDLDTFNGLFEVVKNVESQGKKLKKYKIGQQDLQFEDVKSGMLEVVEGKPDTRATRRQRKNQNRTLGDRVSAFVAGLDAAVRKVEFMLQDLDGESVGPWHQAIFQRLADAQIAEQNANKEVMQPLLNALENLPGNVRKRMKKTIFVPSLGRNMKRRDLLMLALNAGNQSNLQKVIDGSENDNGAKPWSEQDIDEALQLISPEEAAWVQEVWNKFENLRPEVERIFREENGRAPERVEGRPITVGGVELKGGYFPMMYDPSRAATQVAGPQPDNALEAMRSSEVQASVYSGMTKERTNFAAPVLLSLDQMPRAIQRTLHFITHYDAVRDVQRVIRDKQIKEAVRNKLGPQYYDELTNWLGAVASNGMSNMDTTAWGAAFEQIRTNTTLAVMGFSYTTGVSQVFGLSTSLAVLGKKSGDQFSLAEGLKWMRIGMTQYLKNPRQVKHDAFERSGEMRGRVDNFDREVNDVMKKLGGKNTTIAWYQRTALRMIGEIQLHTVDLPTWIGAYNQGLSRGMSDEKAISHADSTLRTSQASGSVKDLSALQRERGLTRVITMFSTFLMVLYNLQRQTLGKGVTAVKEKDLKKASQVITQMALLVAVPALVDGLMRDDIPDEDDEEGLAAWAALRTLGFALSAIPVAGRAADSAIQGYDVELSPIENAGQKVVDAFGPIGDMLQGEEIDEVSATVAIDAIGFGFGIGGTTQLKRFTKAWEAGDEATWYDFLIGHNE